MTGRQKQSAQPESGQREIDASRRSMTDTRIDLEVRGVVPGIPLPARIGLSGVFQTRWKTSWRAFRA